MAISATSFFLIKRKIKIIIINRARARERKNYFCFGVIKPKGLGPRARGMFPKRFSETKSQACKETTQFPRKIMRTFCPELYAVIICSRN